MLLNICSRRRSLLSPLASLRTIISSRISLSSSLPEDVENGDNAFEMASSNIRFGRGATKEVGMDLQGMGIMSRVVVFTDPKLVHLAPALKVFDSLTNAGISYDVFDQVRVEPTDISIMEAITYCKSKQFDAFVAVGGGSVMDTAKAANLYMSHPDNEFLDFVNAPIGKGQPVSKPLKPLIAIPTTAGTGSETTGIAIFDHLPTGTSFLAVLPPESLSKNILEHTPLAGAKTGIRDRALKPTLGIIDPDHTISCSVELTAFSGLDVLCHALESYTAIPFAKRPGKQPSSPLLRPAYQGCNPISDIWSAYALQQVIHTIQPTKSCHPPLTNQSISYVLPQISQYLIRAVEDNDPIAREKMGLAATAAGIPNNTTPHTLPIIP